MTWKVQASQDSDVVNYINAVETADGQSLEAGVKLAYHNFIIGCKADGIWDAIKASCILAGARTLNGALVPLVGAAPTNFNFVSGDYDRKTGLLGDASTKYLNSNRTNDADPQDDNHNAVYASALPTSGVSFMGAGVSSTGANNLLSTSTRSRNANTDSYAVTLVAGFAGHSRDLAATYVNRGSGVNATISRVSQTPPTRNLYVFARNSSDAPSFISNPRLSFYSIGENLDLALLDARVSRLMSDIEVAIP